MIEALVYLLIVLLVLIIVFAIIRLAAAQFGIPPGWIQIVGYILALIFLIVVLNTLGLFAGHPFKFRP
jgi:hypothetical protein